MMNWKVGDRAIVNCHVCPRNNGKVVTILQVGVQGTHYGTAYVGCQVDLPAILSTTHEFCVYENHELIPILDNGSWSELEKSIGWNPTKEVCHVDIG